MPPDSDLIGATAVHGGIIGRHENLSEALRLLNQEYPHLHFFGMSGVGITALLDSARTRRIADGPDAHSLVASVFVPLPDDSAEPHLLRSRFADSLGRALPPPQEDTDGAVALAGATASAGPYGSDWWTRLGEVVGSITGRRVAPVLIMEDVDRTVLWEDEHLAYALRELVDTGRAHLLTTSTRAPSTRSDRAKGARELLRSAATRYVLPLCFEDTRALAERTWSHSSLRGSHEHHEWVYRCSGGNPRLILECCEVLATGEGLLEPTGLLGSLTHPVLRHRVAPTLSRIWRMLDQEQRSLLVSQAGTTPFEADADTDPLALGHLAALGILVRTGNAYRFSSSLLEDHAARGRTPHDAFSQLMRACQPIQRRLYLALLARVNSVVSRRSLAVQVWGDESAATGRTLDVQVSRLRGIITACDRGSGLLGVIPEAIRGSGYQLSLRSPEAATGLSEAREAWLHP
jgi:hypothetical protein